MLPTLVISFFIIIFLFLSLGLKIMLNPKENAASKCTSKHNLDGASLDCSLCEHNVNGKCTL